MLKLSENQTKQLARFCIALLSVLFMFGIFNNLQHINFRSTADELDLEVDVINSVPVFTGNPEEVPISTASEPTNSDETLTFLATAEDSDGDDYFLIVCSQSGVAVPGAGLFGDPICSSGITYCVTGATTESTQAECENPLDESDSESNTWYAYACDGESCVEFNPGGSSDELTPFIVNHRPAFTTVNATSSANPGGSITFTSTASDSDTAGSNDTVKIIVCKTNSANNSGCTGGVPDTLCTSSLTSSNPTCNYTVPSVHPAQSITYYAFVFDNHGYEATSSRTGSFSVNNVAIDFSDVVINSGNPISLVENSTTNITLTATLLDSNSCQDIDYYDALAFLSPEQSGSCQGETEGNYDISKCVPDTVVTCSISEANTCTGPTDASMEIECTLPFNYHIEPTGSGTRYPSVFYSFGVLAYDDGPPSLVGDYQDVTVNSLVALNVTSSITYGQLLAGQNTGSTNETTTVTATGNVGLDVEISGTNLTNGGNTIPVGNQKYSLSPFNYSAGPSLSTTPTNLEINIPKTTVTNSPETAPIYWGIAIPAVAGTGTYNGTVSITGLLGETGEW